MVENATALVRAALLYQEAVWIIENTPELSWIMLTSAIEAVADQWKTATASPIDIIRASSLGQDLESILREYGGDKGDELVQSIARKISRYIGATRKFVDFIIEFLPSEPPIRPPQNAQHPWNAAAMKETMSKLYDYRSRALHGGHPFPAPMCTPSWGAGEQGEL
jgi:hypothetical protein